MKIVRNYHDDLDLIGLEVADNYGYSYDPRRLALYKLSNGALCWLPDWVFE